MRASRLRRWVNGYTYWLHRAHARVRQERPPVISKRELPIVRGVVTLSFLELMELRVVRVLVDRYRLPLQTVRKAAQVAQRTFETRYPFASRAVYIEGQQIFAALSTDPDDAHVIELRLGRTAQIQWALIFEPLMREVEFHPQTSLAERWWPLGRDREVVLDPAVMFGAPVIAGSRVRTNLAAAMAAVSSAAATAAAFGIPESGVRAAVELERRLKAA